MISVLLSGASGRMGRCICQAVAEADDMCLVGCFSPTHAGETICAGGMELVCSDDLDGLIASTKPDVMVDFSRPDSALANVGCALEAGVDVVLGTTGSSEDELRSCWEQHAHQGARLFYAANFTTGAVLMMRFAALAAPYFEDAEIIEMHHNGKKDAPSGTAVKTARGMAAARGQEVRNAGPGAETELAAFKGARGCELDGIRIHAVRGNGYMASQEVILSCAGQTLTLRHDSTQREAYMPGVLLAIRSMGIEGCISGFQSGLDSLL